MLDRRLEKLSVENIVFAAKQDGPAKAKWPVFVDRFIREGLTVS